MKTCLLLSYIWTSHGFIVPSFSPTKISSNKVLRLKEPSRVSLNPPDNNDESDNNSDADEEFLRNELAKLETLEEILDELSEFQALDNEHDTSDVFDLMQIAGGDDSLGSENEYLWDTDSLNELLSSIQDESSEGVGATSDIGSNRDGNGSEIQQSAIMELEQALLQGVVPVTASVGANMLPGDFGFDPLNLATKDYFKRIQFFLLNLLPPKEGEDPLPSSPPERPTVLILRDYREAEIRHSRLAMLAAVFWPLQEMLDRLILDEGQYGSLLFGPVTLPYFPLTMTAIMMLLGYLDIFSQSIKEAEGVGEAYLPGDCFWDPLSILQGAPHSMKCRMQERELFNGRASMLAVLAYVWEEITTGRPLIEIESNAILFTPAYQIPFIQTWLDSQFADTLDRNSDLMQTLGETSDLISTIF